MFRNIEESKHAKDGITYFERFDVNVGAASFHRFAIQTHFINQGENYLELMKKYVMPLYEEGDILSIGEKVISMCQNNIVDKKDVKVGFWAKFLSKFATSNHHGIAMDEPYKLQLAINLAGLPRVLWAALCSAITKIFGKKGVFYEIVGHGVDGIDGFYERSSFEIYKNIAVLNPIDPDSVCNEIQNEFKMNCMIVDANDLSITILGKSENLKNLSDEFLTELIRDNPAGQSDELTPFILIKPFV